ncbi:MAG: nucleoside-diphosphate-sugar epimerase [halophilic archaeon J07HB67]|nr:MAG: nucleoside-diphosphate-sugar epimerase [halophilic archaeon J07HB67]
MTVVGAGYVGLALCRRLAAAGHQVTGVRRSPEPVREAGIDAVAADVTDPETLTALPDADAVVFAASSGGRGPEPARRVFVDGLENTIHEYAGRGSTPERLVYTSSTGVYGDHDGDWVDEETPLDPQTEKTAVLAEAERVAVETAADAGIDGTVARFAGLYGPDRYRLERYVNGPVTQGYLNMLHRDDAAGAVRFLLTGESPPEDDTPDTPRSSPADHARGGVVTVVDDEPVEKWTFADWLADECDAARPEKRTKAERIAAGELSAAARRRIRTSKRVDNAKLRELGYEFRFPTFRSGYRDAVEAYTDG